MQLWTHHPADFRVDNPDLPVDWRKGEYAQLSMEGFGYRNVLPKLHTLVGTTQFLWCCTERGRYQRVTEHVDNDLVEWELNVPLTQILAFYRETVWEDIVWSRRDDWQQLLVAVGETEPAASETNDLGALVRVPLDPKWAKWHGRLPPKYPR